MIDRATCPDYCFQKAVGSGHSKVALTLALLGTKPGFHFQNDTPSSLWPFPAVTAVFVLAIQQDKFPSSVTIKHKPDMIQKH